MAELPVDKEIHVILDNYSTHKRNADWLAKYEGRAQFHLTPTLASWLKQIEIWLGLLTRKSLYQDELFQQGSTARRDGGFRRQD